MPLLLTVSAPGNVSVDLREPEERRDLNPAASRRAAEVASNQCAIRELLHSPQYRTLKPKILTGHGYAGLVEGEHSLTTAVVNMKSVGSDDVNKYASQNRR